jgi:hypothetical protein
MREAADNWWTPPNNEHRMDDEMSRDNCNNTRVTITNAELKFEILHEQQMIIIGSAELSNERISKKDEMDGACSTCGDEKYVLVVDIFVGT